jgi:HAD superfamily hydrolase (TIGR01509 family)
LTSSGPKSPSAPAVLFDLDGTLIDSVYQHVLAWGEALEQIDLRVSNSSIHRHIGMSGGLLVRALSREAGRQLSPSEIPNAEKLHAAAFEKHASQVRVLAGAAELLQKLSLLSVRWAIATSGKRQDAEPFLRMLGVEGNPNVITRDEVSRAKPDPDLFLVAAKKLGTDIKDCVVVGDSVWDLLAARRARALGVGVLCGGFGEDELVRAGAYRVYRDPADLLAHLDEIGVKTED